MSCACNSAGTRGLPLRGLSTERFHDLFARELKILIFSAERLVEGLQAHRRGALGTFRTAQNDKMYEAHQAAASSFASPPVHTGLESSNSKQSAQLPHVASRQWLTRLPASLVASTITVLKS